MNGKKVKFFVKSNKKSTILPIFYRSQIATNVWKSWPFLNRLKISNPIERGKFIFKST
jgi:hypothetical protein